MVNRCEKSRRDPKQNQTNRLNEYYKEDIGIYIVPPKSVKKFGTQGNNGNADKKELAIYAPKEVKMRFSEEGYKISTGFYDLIDSYFIGLYSIDKEVLI